MTNSDHSPQVSDSDWGFEYPAGDSDIFCPICLSVYEDPVRSVCNHSFCKRCILDYVKSIRESRERLTCPLCRIGWNGTTFQTDWLCAKRVDILQIKCRVCRISVCYGQRAVHRSSCPKQSTSTTRHMRSCQLCDQQFDGDSTMKRHWAECRKTNLTSCSICGNCVHKSYLLEHERCCRRGRGFSSSSSNVNAHAATENVWVTAGLVVLGVVALGLFAFLGIRR
ncbi:hypothetical protein PHET_04895 [Paragonimus heterotremus]|uniref:RING-type domain-containing protein n=1 Tax=Paragonimus heterotremus TaxID=100268 RepID=A0A8J4WRP2_9TREM|nr:hypothetical protein PHET_04895 [Paragonimus heterotremus]